MRDKFSNILWGLAFIAVGIGFAGNAFGLWDFRLFFNGWWTLFIIVPCLISMIQNGVNTGNIIVFVIGILLFVNSNGFLPRHIVSKLVFPVILILIGFNIVFRGSFKSNYRVNIQKNYVGKDGYISMTSIFTSHEVRPVNESVRGGAASAVFGNIQVDLRNAIINQDVTINVTSIFGGVDIFIPPNVNVKVSSIPIFGGVSNKASQCNLVNCPTIYVNATCIFGGVNIK
jgi:predicted membrane protein